MTDHIAGVRTHEKLTDTRVTIGSHHDQINLMPELVVIENRQYIALALTRDHFKTGFFKTLMRCRKLRDVLSVRVINHHQMALCFFQQWTVSVRI